MKTKKILIIMMTLLVAVAGFFCWKLIESEQVYKKGRQYYDDLRDQTIIRDEVSGYLTIDQEKLMLMNEDYIGWLDVPGTKISYPLVQASDNDYYLRLSFEQTDLYSGVIFLDCSNDARLLDLNSILYGHNMKDGSMFHDVEQYKDSSYFDEYPIIHFYQDDSIYIYHIYSFDLVDENSAAFATQFDSSQSYRQWLQQQKDASKYVMGVQEEIYIESSIAQIATKIGMKKAIPRLGSTITLSTCDNSNDVERYIIQAALTEIVKPE